MSTRKNNKIKKNDETSWSGVVHKMCGLWSSEVGNYQYASLWTASFKHKYMLIISYMYLMLGIVVNLTYPMLLYLCVFSNVKFRVLVRTIV